MEWESRISEQLAELALGEDVVEPFGDTSDPHEDSVGGAVAQLRELGWPLQCIALKDERGAQRGLGYTLEAPFVPGWTWAAPIPVIRMAS